MDLSKLTPAPWFAGNEEAPCVYDKIRSSYQSPLFEPNESTPEDAEFIALARNAFDAQERRCKQGWILVWEGDRYVIFTANDKTSIDFPWQKEQNFQDGFTAWYEADKWYAENVEAKQ